MNWYDMMQKIKLKLITAIHEKIQMSFGAQVKLPRYGLYKMHKSYGAKCQLWF